MKRVHFVVLSALVVLTVAIGAGQAPSGADRLNADVFASLKVRNIGPTLVTGRVVGHRDRSEEPERLVRRVGVRRSVEDRRIAASRSSEIFPIGSGEVEALHPLLRRRRSEGLEHRLAGHGREQQPAQRALRHGPLQVHRRRQDLEAASASRSPSTSARSSIDPRNSNTVFVAAQGPLFTEEGGGDRGLYKTTDGGATWTRSFFTSTTTTGVTDIVFDPKNPDIMFAGTLSAHASRRPDDRRRPGRRRVQDDRRRQEVDEADERACRPAKSAASRSRSIRRSPAACTR